MATKKVMKKTKKNHENPFKKRRLLKERQPNRVKPTGQTSQTRIKIIGVGGGGNSIVSEIACLSADSRWRKNFKKVDFIAINTDLQALSRVSKNCKIVKIGQDLTGGLGCGMDPGLGRMAALKAKEEIKKHLEGADFCLLLACLGGGTGSGSCPVITEICRSLKQITLGIFTLPFKFEGEKKAAIARNSLKKMKPNLNAVNIVPNERIFQLVEKDTSLKAALSAINQRFTFTLAGLMNMIYSAGLINLDWADFKTVLEGKGRRCYLNRVKSSGQNMAQAAAEEVVRNPLNDYGLEGADRILFNVEGDKGLKMQEVAQVSQFIFNFNKKAKIIFGVSLAGTSGRKPDKESGIGITLLATGTEKASGKSSPLSKNKDSVGPSSSSPHPPVPKARAPRSYPTGQAPKESKHPTGQAEKTFTEKGLQQEKKQALINPHTKGGLVAEGDKISKASPHYGVGVNPQPQEGSAKEAEEDKKKKRPRSKKGAGKVIPILSFSKKKLIIGSQQKTEAKPSLEEKPKTIRKNALTLKKEIEKAEKEILMAEKKWDSPAFLRKK